MTCEILIMNRHAITMAADSAVTVTRWIGNKEETRYFKGVNKVFQLSNHHPVGMMVYGSGDLNQAPWELLAKEYRSQLETKSFDDIKSYGIDLFSYIQNATDIFPRSYQEQVFISNCDKAAFFEAFNYTNYNDSYLAAATDAEKILLSTTYFSEAIQNIDKEPLPTPFIEADLEEALKLFHEQIKETLAKSIENIDAAKIAEFAIKTIYKKHTYLGESGVVIAGFGDKDYYPGFCEFKCFGNILGKIAYKVEDSQQIDYQNHSRIKAFATTHMVDTFQYGMGLETFALAGTACEENMKELAKALGKDNDPNLEALIEAQTANFRTAFIQKSREKNYWPLTRIVAALPIDEMANLAETLVALESLKEKVTKPTESVGGPVDVATITRSDGMIWIKRKHYFPSELNPKYFKRLAS